MGTSPPAIIQIADDDLLYRRITSFQMNPDGTVNSAAFKLRNSKPDPSASVEVARLTTQDECLARPGRPGFGLAGLLAGAPRGMGLKVRHDPCPPGDPSNVAHALIEGASTKQHIRDLAAAATVLVPPGLHGAGR